ncbi:MAG: cytochrome d ubiquinol oxidase subunit II [Pseudomonadota bacterium]|nr:cytochrome d ubiquinol oxidase subunit II [Pseudomonadota bacterium]
MTPDFLLPHAAAAIIALAVFMYVVLDGFDLGIGILFPLFPKKSDRAILLSSIMPIWDGNQTWLVLGGALLYGAFPVAFSALLPTIYIPMILMVLSLLLRGAAIEFRAKSSYQGAYWDIVFSLASFAAAICQGMILGTYVTGFGQIAPSYQQIPLTAWLTPFSLMTGFGLASGYALLGSAWIILKTEGVIQSYAFRYAKNLTFITLFFLALYCLWVPYLSTTHYGRWYAFETLFNTTLLASSVLLFIILLILSLAYKFERGPFVCTVLLFFSSTAGVINTVYPYIIPHSVTLTNSASSLTSLRLVLSGCVLMLPLLFIYTIAAHWVFRGKVTTLIEY